MISELSLRVDICLVHDLLNHCVKPRMCPLILSYWKPGGEGSEPQLLDLTSRSLGIILIERASRTLVILVINDNVDYYD